MAARVVTSPSASLTYTYQWMRDGIAISGATKYKYIPVAADRNKKLTVQLTAAVPGTPGASVVSTPVTIKIGLMKTTRPKISGVASVGRALKANATKWTKGVKKKYQWYRGTSKISGANKVRYTLTQADRGKRITVKVTGTKDGYKSVVRASASKRVR
jgi:hypothetical protein